MTLKGSLIFCAVTILPFNLGVTSLHSAKPPIRGETKQRNVVYIDDMNLFSMGRLRAQSIKQQKDRDKTLRKDQKPLEPAKGPSPSASSIKSQVPTPLKASPSASSAKSQVPTSPLKARPGLDKEPTAYPRSPTSNGSGSGKKGMGKSKPMKSDKLKKEKDSKSEKGGEDKGMKKGMCKGKVTSRPTSHPISRAPIFPPPPTPSRPTASQTNEPSTRIINRPPLGLTPSLGFGPSVGLAPFVLFYDIDQSSIPTTREVDEVVEVTRMYLRAYFVDNLDVIFDFTTAKIRSNFTLNEDYQIKFNSTAIFLANTVIIPEQGELEQMLADAFQGENLDKYVALLQSLNNNIFSTVQPPSQASEQGASDVGGSSVAVMVAAGAGALVLGTLMFIIWRRKGESDSLGKHSKIATHVTLAGDTYEASTMYPATESLAGETNAGDTTLNSAYIEDRQTHLRPAPGDEKSQTEQSEWGAVPTSAISEHDSESDTNSDAYTTAGTDFVEARFEASEDTMTIAGSVEVGDAGSVASSDGVSEDENVPMRVVDLIQRFSRR